MDVYVGALGLCHHCTSRMIRSIFGLKIGLSRMLLANDGIIAKYTLNCLTQVFS